MILKKEVVHNQQIVKKKFKRFSKASYPFNVQQEIIIAHSVVKVFNGAVTSQDHIVGAYVFTHEITYNSFFLGKEVFVYLKFQKAASRYLIGRTAIVTRILSLVERLGKQHNTEIAIVISYVGEANDFIFEDEKPLPPYFHDDTTFHSLFA